MAEETEELFIFNGIDGVSGDYLWPHMTATELADLAQSQEPDEGQQEAAQHFTASAQQQFALREGVDPKDLAQSGWGVIFAHDEDPAVREALQPLLRHREAQAGSRFREFWGSNSYHPNERKTAFLKRQGAATSGPVDPDRMPYYLLIVGSPETISTEFQAQLDLQYAVGRLHFETPAEYDNYARSVIASENGEVRTARRLGLFGPRNPNDRATSVSADNLIGGLDRYVEDKFPAWSRDVRVAEHATKVDLAAMLGGSETPAVLFTASHGVGFPMGERRQLPHQGALMCQDWLGPRSGRVSQDVYFAGDDLGDSAQFSGLIAFLFACYGGGTPRFDAFSHRKRGKRRPIAPHAFIADLPRRMLGHPRGGALAAVAHIDRAWGCSFYEPKGDPQIAVFESFMHRLLSGHPIGSALEPFGCRYGEVSSDLLQKFEDMRYGDTSISQVELISDWTASNDARNYLVLGDPAVRVPTLDGSDAQARTVVEIRSVAASPTPHEHRTPESEPELSKLRRSIATVLEDKTTVEVKTYIVDDVDELVVEGGQVAGAKLRAFTRIELDGDTVMYVPKRDGEIDQADLEIHLRMVEQAQKARVELMKTLFHATRGDGVEE